MDRVSEIVNHSSKVAVVVVFLLTVAMPSQWWMGKEIYRCDLDYFGLSISLRL